MTKRSLFIFASAACVVLCVFVVVVWWGGRAGRSRGPMTEGWVMLVRWGHKGAIPGNSLEKAHACVGEGRVEGAVEKQMQDQWKILLSFSYNALHLKWYFPSLFLKRKTWKTLALLLADHDSSVVERWVPVHLPLHRTSHFLLCERKRWCVLYEMTVRLKWRYLWSNWHSFTG